ncbi:HNH endonuclease signature motif containing protein [Streptomyces sp. SM13]|uniref:HNH endonuclease signature motif containing protein n=1 Tax=Streptomyces sp. SM13 TaxID=1983803 RepID=UPI0035BBFC50
MDRRVDVALLAEFHAKAQRTDTCWIWTGIVDQYGYGKLRDGAHLGSAHRISHELFVGLIPEGLQVDHLCHNADDDCAGGDGCLHRRCVNPAHLEAVTKRTNLLRGKTIVALAASRTHCPKGHPYDEGNTVVQGDGKRRCRACRQAAARRRPKRERHLVPASVMRLVQARFPDEDLAAVLDRAVRLLIQERGTEPTTTWSR